MQIFVKTIENETLVIQAEPTNTISWLRAKIKEKQGSPPHHNFNLIYCSRIIYEDGTLAKYGIKNMSTLWLTANLRGGAKKRKKKNYSTPKKIKHQKKKNKLAVLKYYKVDESGKIHRLRRECPNLSCGAGVFMAAHPDRHYCGKCHMTFVFLKSDD